MARLDAERCGVSVEAKNGPDGNMTAAARMLTRANVVARQDAAALAARSPVDMVEVHVATGVRALVQAAEKAAALRADLGPVGRDLVAAARGAVEVDRALVRLAAERERAARASLERAEGS